jgi:hypothetical protein
VLYTHGSLSSSEASECQPSIEIDFSELFAAPLRRTLTARENSRNGAVGFEQLLANKAPICGQKKMLSGQAQNIKVQTF